MIRTAMVMIFTQIMKETTIRIVTFTIFLTMDTMNNAIFLTVGKTQITVIMTKIVMFRYRKTMTVVMIAPRSPL